MYTVCYRDENRYVFIFGPLTESEAITFKYLLLKDHGNAWISFVNSVESYELQTYIRATKEIE